MEVSAAGVEVSFAGEGCLEEGMEVAVARVKAAFAGVGVAVVGVEVAVVGVKAVAEGYLGTMSLSFVEVFPQAFKLLTLSYMACRNHFMYMGGVNVEDLDWSKRSACART